MKKAKISISRENNDYLPEHGMVFIWWWKEGSELNDQLVSIKPIWEIFNSQEIYMLCIEIPIEVPVRKIHSNFKSINPL